MNNLDEFIIVEDDYDIASSVNSYGYNTGNYTNEIIDIASDSAGAASSINRIAGSTITIVRVTLPLLFLVCLIVNTLKIYKLKKDSNYEANKKLKACKARRIIFIILFVISCIISGLLGIVKSFKPIIYIYPEEEMTVSVELGYPEKITTSYPKYEEKWKVIAKPTGDLIDLKTGRNLYSLYWEGDNKYASVQKDGFIVKGEDTAEFLEEKLEILGLNYKEAEEFIIYWLPKMEHNKYNYIRFETMDEINEYMPLEINPKPDTLIRIHMDYKKLSFPIEVEEQELTKVERRGYTVVEWGGSELKNTMSFMDTDDLDPTIQASDVSIPASSTSFKIIYVSIIVSIIAISLITLFFIYYTVKRNKLRKMQNNNDEEI